MPFPAEGDEDRRRAIERALAWLATRQESRDGSVSVGDAGENERAPLAVTSLAALAWMAGGSTVARGPHQRNVARAIEYLLASTHRAADPYPGYIEDRGDPISRTHGHGLATLALAHAYTVSPGSSLGKRIGEALVSAVRRIEVSQGAEGGWYYDPARSLQHEGSVTVSLVQALRAADEVGVRVDPRVIARAVEYVESLQVMDRPASKDPSGGGDAGSKLPSGASTGLRLGGFRYGQSDPKTSVALTAAGLVTLQATGLYDGPRIDEGFDYIWRALGVRDEDPDAHAPSFPYYERFYLSQALWHMRDTSQYRRWAEPIMRQLVEAQRSNGSWQDVRKINGQRFLDRYGACYATASNVLFLALPDDTLPLFHR